MMFHVSSSWNQNVFWSIEELKCFMQCAGVNVKNGGVFREPRRMVILSSSCLALVVFWCADKRLFSAVVLVRVGRALLCSFPASVRARSQRLIRLHHGSSEKFIRTVLHAYVAHLLNLVAERWVPGTMDSLDRSFSLHSA